MKSSSMAKFDRRRISTVLAANADFEIRRCLAPAIGSQSTGLKATPYLNLSAVAATTWSVRSIRRAHP
jgi:hypothetical protein